MSSADLTRAAWRKSTRSGSTGACVEVAITSHVVGIRDSKDRTGPSITFPPAAWANFATELKDGLYDR